MSCPVYKYSKPTYDACRCIGWNTHWRFIAALELWSPKLTKHTAVSKVTRIIFRKITKQTASRLNHEINPRMSFSFSEIAKKQWDCNLLWAYAVNSASWFSTSNDCFFYTIPSEFSSRFARLRSKQHNLLGGMFAQRPLATVSLNWDPRKTFWVNKIIVFVKSDKMGLMTSRLIFLSLLGYEYSGHFLNKIDLKL